MHDIWMKHADLILWSVGLVVLILLAGFFSLAETGMMAINRYRLRHSARQGKKAAIRTQKLLERPDRLLGVVLIGNTFANIFASSIATYIAVRLLGDLGILIATFALTFIILIFGEMTPKILAAIYPEKVAFLVSLPLRILLTLFYPLVFVANLVANSVLFLFGVRVKKKNVAERLNAEELRTVVYESVDHDHAVEVGSRKKVKNKDMLLAILDLKHVVVEDVMLPRNHVIGIDLDDNWDDIVNRITLSEHSRLPVYYGSLDNVIGVLRLADALRLMGQNRLNRKTIIKSLLEPYFIPEGTSLYAQLHEFRLHQRRFALIVDEYGDILGIVTLQDILEEIVGELDIDSASIQSQVFAEEAGGAIVMGTASIRELNKFLNWELPVDGPKTLSGLILEHLETIPSGLVCLTIESYRIEVLEQKHHRVVKVKIMPESL